MKKIILVLSYLLAVAFGSQAKVQSTWINWTDTTKHHTLTAAQMADLASALMGKKINPDFVYNFGGPETNFKIPHPDLYLEYIVRCVQKSDPSAKSNDQILSAIESGEVVNWDDNISTKVRNYFYSEVHKEVRFVGNFSGAEQKVPVLLINGFPTIKMQDCGNPLEIYLDDEKIKYTRAAEIPKVDSAEGLQGLSDGTSPKDTTIVIVLLEEKEDLCEGCPNYQYQTPYFSQAWAPTFFSLPMPMLCSYGYQQEYVTINNYSYYNYTNEVVNNDGGPVTPPGHENGGRKIPPGHPDPPSGSRKTQVGNPDLGRNVARARSENSDGNRNGRAINGGKNISSLRENSKANQSSYRYTRSTDGNKPQPRFSKSQTERQIAKRQQPVQKQEAQRQQTSQRQAQAPQHRQQVSQHQQPAQRQEAQRQQMSQRQQPSQRQMQRSYSAPASRSGFGGGGGGPRMGGGGASRGGGGGARR